MLFLCVISGWFWAPKKYLAEVNRTQVFESAKKVAFFQDLVKLKVSGKCHLNNEKGTEIIGQNLVSYFLHEKWARVKHKHFCKSGSNIFWAMIKASSCPLNRNFSGLRLKIHAYFSRHQHNLALLFNDLTQKPFDCSKKWPDFLLDIYWLK